LFGADDNGRLNSGLSFDEDTYAKAKPHFKKSYEATLKAGKSLKEFVRIVAKSFGAKVKPYLIKFADDVNTGKIIIDKADLKTKVKDKGSVEDEGSKRNGTKTDSVHEGQLPDKDKKDEERGNLSEIRDDSPTSSGETTDKPNEGRSPSDGSGHDGSKGNAVLSGKRGLVENYHIPKNHVGSETFSPTQRLEDNLEALELLVKLLDEDRPATKTEQKILFKYVGWGGLKDDINPPTNRYLSGPQKERMRRLEAIVKKLSLEVLPPLRVVVLNSLAVNVPLI
jgi:hypothetical protein